MYADASALTQGQRQKLCELLYGALIEMRMLGWAGKSEQAADLADAFHNLPTGMWQNFSLVFFREAFLAPYQRKYPGERMRNYVAMVDTVIAMKGA